MAYSMNHFQTQSSDTEEFTTGCYYRYTSHKILTDEYLENLIFSEDSRYARLVGAMRYSLLASGERVRPALCMEVASSFGLDPVEVLPSAAAIELIHTASLIHDGLPAMDGEDSRREIPRCHEKFGHANAILAGDALFNESVALITSYQSGTAKQILAVVGELATAVGVAGMIGGQVLGIMDGADRGANSEALETMHNYRTGALIEASARIGAILAGASAKEKEDISEYARWLGLCLRITSDTLKADSSGGGSDQGTAEDCEEISFVQVYGFSEARRLADEAFRKALEVLGRLNGDTRGLAEMVRLARSPRAAGLSS